jgi:hypothetical protein
MRIALAQYIRFKTKSNVYVPSRSYQNFFIGETRSLLGVPYTFAPFRISGSISNKGGDTAQASLTTIPNALTVGACTEAVLNYWLLEVSTYLISATSLAPEVGEQLIGTETGSFTEAGLLATELWSCSTMGQDYEKISITLSSPLDATRRQVPRRVLSEGLVGSVPATGNITAS